MLGCRPSLVAFAILLALSVPWCLAGIHPRDLTVKVRDAETKEPVTEAKVTLSYVSRTGPLAPNGYSKETEGGRAELLMFPGWATYLRATAGGYLPFSTEDIEQELLQHCRDRAPFVIELFQGPEAMIQLRVPDGYRGPVLMQVVEDDQHPARAGQRLFQATVSPSGVAVVNGPALLNRPWCQVEARFANGMPITGGKSE